MAAADTRVAPLSELDLKLDTFIAVLSASNTGKSYLVGDLVQNLMKKGIDYIYMFSSTAAMNRHTNEQYEFIDTKALLPADPETITRVVTGLMESQKKTENKFKVLIILDDIILSHRYGIVERLATMGRHYGITVILSAQIANTAVSPPIRNNIKYLFFRKLPLFSVRDNIFPILSSTMTEFEDVRDLWTFLKANNHDHQFLFFNNNIDSDTKHRLRIIKANAIDPTYRYILRDYVREEREREDKKNAKIMNCIGTGVHLPWRQKESFAPDPYVFGKWD